MAGVRSHRQGNALYGLRRALEDLFRICSCELEFLFCKIFGIKFAGYRPKFTRINWRGRGPRSIAPPGVGPRHPIGKSDQAETSTSRLLRSSSTASTASNAGIAPASACVLNHHTPPPPRACALFYLGS